jgi:hypothetical protein
MDDTTKPGTHPRSLENLKRGNTQNVGRKRLPDEHRRTTRSVVLSPLEVEKILAMTACSSLTEFCQGVASGAIRVRRTPRNGDMGLLSGSGTGG